MRNKLGGRAGFTIVELLIVIVVIGILAAIVIVAFNGVQNRAQNSSRLAEMKSWQKLFEGYKAVNGNMPVSSSGYYCLGTGFPSTPGGGNVPRCRNYNDASSANSYLETTGSVIISALSTVGTIPESDKVPLDSIVGPYLQYAAGTGGYITGWFRGSSSAECPAGTTFGWTDGVSWLSCYIFVSET